MVSSKDAIVRSRQPLLSTDYCALQSASVGSPVSAYRSSDHLLSFVELNNNLGMRLALNPTIFRICFEIFKGFYEIHIIQSILWKYIFVLPTFKQLKRIRGLLKILDNRT